ncbi:hypothetical protein AH04_13 [Erwinia phage AH04]|uniref:Uncharacterized protein n=1 Tax=Erwinia phage AH04 TaxID=2869569 RepID=A0AAE7X0P3_9CAUD|nr:hypothetical protein PQC02_gp013 [Erwinia phage AH04]QZA70503.1 hypothetical protein AH04_13 [Erwinia phage AH04]
MLLKKITLCEDGTTDTDYVHLCADFTVVHPDMNGSFGKRTFGYEEETPEPGVVAVLNWSKNGGKPIFIFEDQEAYIIGDDGKTITVIHKQAPLKVWYRDKRETKWFSLDICGDTALKMAYVRDCGMSYSHLEFITVREGKNPNVLKPVDEMVTVTWYLDTRSTSKSWRKVDATTGKLDTRYTQLIVVREDQDPNTPGFHIS